MVAPLGLTTTNYPALLLCPEVSSPKKKQEFLQWIDDIKPLLHSLFFAETSVWVNFEKRTGVWLYFEVVEEIEDLLSPYKKESALEGETLEMVAERTKALELLETRMGLLEEDYDEKKVLFESWVEDLEDNLKLLSVAFSMGDMQALSKLLPLFKGIAEDLLKEAQECEKDRGWFEHQVIHLGGKIRSQENVGFHRALTTACRWNESYCSKFHTAEMTAFLIASQAQEHIENYLRASADSTVACTTPRPGETDI